MPDESCRNCGGTLIDHSKCSKCNKMIKMICTSCGVGTLEQFHNLCVPYDLLRNNTSMTKTVCIFSGNYGLIFYK